MSDLGEDYKVEEAPPHPADPGRPLTDFVGAFTDPQAREVFRDAAIRIQDYVTKRTIADENAAAANRLVGNLGQFKNGLVEMVQSDPASVTLGMDLVPGVVGGLVDMHPFLPDDQRQSTYDSLAADMQRDIARAGVMSWADRDATVARNMLDSPRVAGLFSDADRAGLSGYIGAMETARAVDNAALARQRAADADEIRMTSAINYFGALLDPRTFDLQFPAGWAERVTADNTLPPGDTASMLGIYGRLQQNGDVDTNPLLAADLISLAAQGKGAPVTSVLNQIGRNLSITDALTIAGMSMSNTPGGRAEVQALAATLQSYRDRVVTPENGPAGVRAFERFVNWIIPQVRGGGGLDPRAENYILPTGDGPATTRFWGDFAPRLDDLVEGAPVAGTVPMNEFEFGRSEDRMSLDQIFGPKRGMAGDRVISPARPFDLNRGNQALGSEVVRMGNTPENPRFDDAGTPVYDNPEIRS